MTEAFCDEEDTPGRKIGCPPEIKGDEILVVGGQHEADLVDVEVAAR